MNLRYVRTQKLRTCIIVQSRYVIHRVLHPASSALHRSRSVWLSAPSISPPLHDDSPHPAPRHTSYRRCDLTATAANARDRRGRTPMEVATTEETRAIAAALFVPEAGVGED